MDYISAVRKIPQKVLACSHPAGLTVAIAMKGIWKVQPGRSWTGSAHFLSAAYRAKDVLWLAINHVWKFPVIPEIRTPLIQVNNTAHAAWAEENSFECELKNHFVPARICTLPGAGVGWGVLFCFSWAAPGAPYLQKYPGMLKWLPYQRRKGPGGRPRGTKGTRGRDGVESRGRGKLSACEAEDGSVKTLQRICQGRQACWRRAVHPNQEPLIINALQKSHFGKCSRELKVYSLLISYLAWFVYWNWVRLPINDFEILVSCRTPWQISWIGS